MGRACDTCVDNHWNLSASNEAGCEGMELGDLFFPF